MDDELLISSLPMNYRLPTLNVPAVEERPRSSQLTTDN
jgi:hypothetical protein